jgi:hypothetical protein
MHRQIPEWDDTQFRYPREAKNPCVGITPEEPAPSGFFVARRLPYMLAVVLALSWAAAISVCTGSSDAQAMQAIAADADLAPTVAEQQYLHQQMTRAVDDIAAQLSGPRPSHISEDEWAASQAAVRITQSNLKGE